MKNPPFACSLQTLNELMIDLYIFFNAMSEKETKINMVCYFLDKNLSECLFICGVTRLAELITCFLPSIYVGRWAALLPRFQFK